MIQALFSSVLSLVCIVSVSCAVNPAILGVGSRGGGYSGPPGLSLEGATFNLDIGSGGLSRIHGNGLRVDLDVLELATSKGLVKYTGNSIEFLKDSSKWIQVFTDKLIGINHNNQPVFKIEGLENSAFYKFTLAGDGTFNDVFVNKDESVKVLINLCMADRTISGEPVEIVNKCATDVIETHLSLEAQIDYASKLLSAVTRELTDTKTKLKTIQTSGSGTEQTKSEVLSTVDTKIQAFQQEVMNENNDHNRKLTSLSQEVTALSDKAKNELITIQADLASLNTTVLTNLTSMSEQFEAQFVALNASLEGVLNQQLTQQLGELTANISDNAAVLAAINETMQANVTALDEKLLILNGNVNSFIAELNNSVTTLENSTTTALSSQSETLLEAVYGVSNQSALAVQTLNDSLLSLIQENQNLTQESVLSIAVELRESLAAINASSETKITELNDSIIAVEFALRESVLTNLTELSAFQTQSLDAVKVRVSLTEDSINLLNASTLQLQDELLQTRTNLTEAVADAESRLDGRLNDTLANLTSTLLQYSSEGMHNLATLNSTVQEEQALLKSSIDSLSSKTSQEIELIRSESVANNTVLYTDLSLALLRDVTLVNETLSKVNTSLLELVNQSALASTVSVEAVNASLRSVVAKNLETLVETTDTIRSDLRKLNESMIAANTVLNVSFVEKSSQLSDLIVSTDTHRKEYVDKLMLAADEHLQSAKAEFVKGHTELSERLNISKDSVLTTLQTVNDSAHSRIGEVVVQLTSLKNDVDKHTDLMELRLINKISELKANTAESNSQWNASHQDLKAQLSVLDRNTTSQFKGVNDTLAASLKSLNQSILTTFNVNLNSMFGYVHNLSDTTRSELTELNSSVKAQLSKLMIASDLQNAKTQQLIIDTNDLTTTTAKALNASLIALNASLLSALAANDVAQLKRAEADRLTLDAKADQLNSSLAKLNDNVVAYHTAALLAVNATQKSLTEQQASMNASWTSSLIAAVDHTKKINDTLTVSVSKLADTVAFNDNAVKLKIAALETDLDKHDISNGAQFVALIGNLNAVNQSLAVLGVSVDKRLASVTEDLTVRMKDLSSAASVNMSTLSSGLTAQMSNLSSTLEKELWKATTQLTHQHTLDGLITNNSIVAVNSKLDLALERLKTANDAAEATNKAVMSSLEVDVKSTRKHLQEVASLASENVLNLNTSLQSFMTAQRSAQSEATRDRSALHAELTQLNKQVVDNAAGVKLELSTHASAARESFDAVQRQLAGVNVSLQSITTQSLLTSQSVSTLSDTSKYLTSQVDSVFDRVVAVESKGTARDLQLQHVNQQLSALSSAVGAVVNTSIPELLVSTTSNAQKVSQLTAAVNDQQALLQQHIDKHNSKVTSLTEATTSGSLAVTALSETLTTYQTTTNEKLTTLTADILVKYDQLIQNNLDSKVVSGVQTTKIEHLESQQAVVSEGVKDLQKSSIALEEQVKRFARLESEFAEYKRLQEVKAEQYLSAVTKLNEKLEQQNSLLVIAQNTITKQGETIDSLQDELKKVMKESASQESVDQLRKLLYDMQASMIGHSSKVLDLLLSKKDSA